MSTETPRREGLLARIIGLCADNPGLTLLLTLVLAGWGAWSAKEAKLDAIPDLSDSQVIIFTEWMGRSPDLVEQQITYPLSASLLGAPKVKAVRGQSMFGMSFVYVIFEDGTDIYWARSRVLEYLSSASRQLPEGVTPQLGPDATGVGWVFQYALVDESGQRSLAELRSLQDWNLRFALQSVEGVAEVASVGGYVKQYQVSLDPVRLRAYGVTAAMVMMAVRESNEDVGGQSIEIAGHEHVIRGRGYVRKLADLEAIAVHTEKGTPVYLRDVATVALGPEPRRGLAELDGRGEVVGGIVVMRYGENALTVIDAVKERLEEVKRGLPSGLKLQIVYDRSELIRASIKTVRDSLLEEMLVVSLVIFAFLLSFRSALVPVLTLPVAVLCAFIPMVWQGLTINIMSLGGIIVAIGAMVDASMVMVENIHKRLEEHQARGGGSSRAETRPVVIDAMKEVGPSLFYTLLVMTVAFIPVFTLTGTEGRLFTPLAYTKTYSMGFASILAVTATPALAALLMRGKVMAEDRHPLNRWLVALYTPVVRFVVRNRWWVLGAAALAMVLTVPAWQRLQSEFMPPLNEGAVLYMPTAPPGMSMTEAANVLQQMDQEIKKIPEVVSVFGKMGRAETATDPAPIGMAETTIVLKPKEQWREGLTWDLLIKEMDERLQFPGMPNIFWMPVQTRTEMLATGIRSPLGIQVFADDIETIERAALDVERAVAKVPGVRSAFAERSTGGFYVDFEVKREEAARYGLRVKDVNDVVLSAIGGMTVTETVEGRERYPISVRYAREYREDPELLKNVLVGIPGGAQVPLWQVADLSFVNGPPMVRSEGGKLVGFVFVDTDRPIAELVQDAKAAVAAEVKLPAGVRLEWAGQFKYLERAREKLSVVVPLTLLLIIFFLYINTKSAVETGIVLLAVPFSLIGAVWLLYLLDYNISVAVWVGLIALAGLDAETGVVMLLYLTMAHRSRTEAGTLRTKQDLEDVIVEGAAQRIRPKLMTVLTDAIGLIPVLWATGTGSDVMKRIAAPLVGGLATSFLLELTVYPALFALWKGRALSAAASSPAPPPAPPSMSAPAPEPAPAPPA